MDQIVNTPWVSVDHDALCRIVVDELEKLDRSRREAAIIVVNVGGVYWTFAYSDLPSSAFDENDELLLGRTINSLLPMFGAVESPAVELGVLSSDTALEAMPTAPKGRLVVLENGIPMGVHRVPDRRQSRRAPTIDGPVTIDTPSDRAAREPTLESASSDPANVPPQRWLGVQVETAGGRRRRSFVAGELHTIDVGIGPADTDMIQSDEVFAESALPPGERHLLEVMVWGTDILDQPLVETLELPSEGATPVPCRFDLIVPAALTRLELHIAVLYKCRLLQAATLVGPVTAKSDPEAAQPAQIELRRSPMASIDLDYARGFEATIVTNDEEVLIDVCGESRRVVLGGLENTTQTIEDRLYAAAAGQARSAGGLDSEDVLDLLRVLAYHGNAIYQELVKGDTAQLANVTTIEVISRNAGDFLPVELIYDRGTPARDAILCPSFVGADAATCPDCKAVGPNSPYVCPLGFWGLSKEIGRRISSEIEDDGQTSAMIGPSSARPTLPPITSVLIAASDKVDKGGTAEMATTVDHARSLLPNAAYEAADWGQWVSVVTEHTPGLLLAMPHTDHDDGFDVDVLQIGENSDLDPLAITADHVGPGSASAGPLLLLLGCTTASQDIAYLGFVPKFMEKNAAIVVGTIAKILGRYTGPVARHLLTELVAAQGSDMHFSEILRRVRISMLQQGNLIGLTLVAYGDADWKLGSPP